MWRLTVVLLALGAGAHSVAPKTGDELVSSVLTNCAEMACVKTTVLAYLDNLLHVESDARTAKVHFTPRSHTTNSVFCRTSTPPSSNAPPRSSRRTRSKSSYLR